MKSVREMIKEIQDEIRDVEPTPTRASELVIKLSSLLGNVIDESLKADQAYNKVLNDLLDAEKTANKARIKADTTPEWVTKRQLENLEKLTIQMIRSLNKFVVMKTEELKSARY